MVQVVAVVYKLLHYCYLAEPKNSATWRRLAASAKGWVRVRFSDVITRGALADQPRTAAPGEIYTFLNLAKSSGKSSYKYVKPAYLLIWEHSPPSCECLVMSRHHAIAAAGVSHIFVIQKKLQGNRSPHTWYRDMLSRL